MVNFWWLPLVSAISVSIGFVLGAAWCALCSINKEYDDRISEESNRVH